MRITILLAIALTIAFATAASAAPRHSTIPPITDTIRVVGTATLPGAPHGVSTDQGFGALTGKPGSPIFDPLAQALGSSSTALLEVELQRLMRTCRLAIIVAAITAVSAVSATGQERLASNMGDVQAHFADCFRPPHDANGSLITFYFSLTRTGQVYGRPRVALLGFNGSPESRRLFVASFLKAFSECLPIPLSEELARTIIGKVYFVQFNVRTSGEVILRPYGSHIGPELRPGE